MAHLKAVQTICICTCGHSGHISPSSAASISVCRHHRRHSMRSKDLQHGGSSLHPKATVLKGDNKKTFDTAIPIMYPLPCQAYRMISILLPLFVSRMVVLEPPPYPSQEEASQVLFSRPQPMPFPRLLSHPSSGRSHANGHLVQQEYSKPLGNIRPVRKMNRPSTPSKAPAESVTQQRGKTAESEEGY